MGCWQPCVNLPRLYGKEQTEIFVNYLVIFSDHGLGRSCLWQVHFLSCLPGSKDAELCGGVQLPTFFLWARLGGCCVEGYRPPPVCLLLCHGTRMLAFVPLGAPLVLLCTDTDSSQGGLLCSC